MNNYYKPGPATEPRVKRRLVRIDDTKAKYGFESIWYIDGNVLEGAKDINKDNWLGVDFVGNTSGIKNRSLEPFATAPVRTQAAGEAYKLVLENVGSNRPKRDVLDARILHEVATGTAPFGNDGIIDSQDDVGGWPQLKSSLALEDADGDGMADSWEIEQGLDSSSPDDRNATILNPSYTNLEVYLNSLADD